MTCFDCLVKPNLNVAAIGKKVYLEIDGQYCFEMPMACERMTQEISFARNHSLFSHSDEPVIKSKMEVGITCFCKDMAP